MTTLGEMDSGRSLSSREAHLVEKWTENGRKGKKTEKWKKLGGAGTSLPSFSLPIVPGIPRPPLS